MIIDLDHADVDSQIRCEVCVVGGGAVGLALAVTLAEKGVDVLVLEGGGATLESKSHALQRGESIGHPFANIDVGRYRVLGGSTAYWGGQVYPFDSFVTGERPWVNHAAWPVKPEELEAYFSRAYELVGLGEAELNDARVWSLIGDMKPEFSDHFNMVMTRWIKTRNFSRLFGKNLRNTNGLRVMTHANVVALGLDGDRKVVQSVVARSLGQKTVEVKAQRFVLANGSLEIARLLMHPLADGSPAPWRQSRFLGAPLIDHLDCVAGQVKVLDHGRFHKLFDNIYLGGYKYYPKLRLSPQTQKSEGLVDIAAQFLYKTRFSEHLEYLKMFLRTIKEGGGTVSIVDLPKHFAAVLSTSLPLAVRYFKDRRSFKPHDAEVSLAFYCEQLPADKSRLLLGAETDEVGMRRLQVDWQIDGRELATMRRFGLLLKDEMEQRGLARITLDSRLLDLDPAFMAEIHDAIHQMGTTRMGNGPDDGFVDANLKVFGIENLFVTGAAVFPSTGFANPTFTALALTLRLGDHLAEISR
jgi:choline dehydrogenase-like flavoprotein